MGPEQPKKNLFAGLLAQRKLQKARESFQAYAELIWPGYCAALHHKFIIAKLERIERGELTRMMCSWPPQHGKTRTISHLFACWYLGRNPQKRVIVASYGEDRSSDTGRDVLRTLRDPKHLEVFPDCQVDLDAASSTRIDLLGAGGFLAVSRNGALTGRNCDLLIVDDLVKDDRESRSPAILRENIAWFNKVGLTRLSPGAPVILVGTRWGNGDLFDDRLLEHPEEDWDVVNLEAVAEEGDILGRRVGQPLWPERFSLEVLQQKRFEIGNSAFTCLYQGNPTAAEGVTFSRDDWQYWTVMPERFQRKVISIDPAVKTGASNDYSAVQCWAKTETGYYLLASWRGKVEYLDLRKTVVEFNAQWKPDCVLIEDTSAGSSLAQDLLSTTSIPVKKITVTRDKESRAAAITPLVECGAVYLPQTASFLADFLDEISQFPRGRHDDMTDACVQALTFLRDSDSILTGWAAQMAGAYALGDKVSAEQKAQLETFASRGVPPTEAPYYGVGDARPCRTLAEAQKAALTGESRGQFNATRNLVKAKVAERPRPVCPKCGNKNLAICGEFKSCVCGWNSQLKEVVA